MANMQAPPENAVILFDGTDLTNWHQKDGSPANWTIDEEGAMTVSKGSIISDETFDDAYVHVEFRCPDMPEAEGQAKGNSGVYLQGRYEIQVLDSYGWEVPGLGDCGGLYNQYAPLVNACKPPMQWQTYEIVFRAPRFDESGEMLEDARMTVLQNGIVVQNNVELDGPTGGQLDEDVGDPGPLLLQDHGNPVSYRNVWLVHLPPAGSDQYDPR